LDFGSFGVDSERMTYGRTFILVSKAPALSGRMTSHSNFDGVAEAIVLVMQAMGVRFLRKALVEYLRSDDMVCSKQGSGEVVGKTAEGP
jgi:hypothetical protein